MWLTAPNLASRHGFSDREGGHSHGVFGTLNLSQNVGDDAATVERNRLAALETLGLQNTRLSRLRQVHSSEVVTVTRDSDPTHLPMADALVTALPGTTLVIETADCYPVLLEDTEAGVIAAAHCGWRGTSSRLLENVLEAMTTLGAQRERIHAAIGPGICAAQYAVNADVITRFAANGFPETAFLEQKGEVTRSGIEQFFVNLERANAWLLTASGLPESNIWLSGRCSTDPAFFSHRRDHGQTGRMWSVISRG
jgi:polyphenol oxidase